MSDPLAIAWLDDPQAAFPPLSLALGHDTDAPGLLAAGGELSTARLRSAYARGIFPWYSEGQPILWWSPHPRMVLPVEAFKLSRSLRRTLKQFQADPRCTVRVDTAFDTVIAACSRVPRAGQQGTWIVPEMIEAYRLWHRQGGTHSFEVWVGADLVGGLYGVGLGRMFFGESMFSLRTDASKIALAALVAFCRSRGITMIDCQQRTAHLASLGAREIDRDRFEAHLRHTVHDPEPASWAFSADMWQALAAPGLEQAA